MGKRGFLSRIRKAWKKRSSSGHKKRYEKEAEASGRDFLCKSPVQTLCITTDLTRGLGRRIPFINDDTFVGIVSYRYVYNLDLPDQSYPSSKCEEDDGPLLEQQPTQELQGEVAHQTEQAKPKPSPLSTRLGEKY